MKGQRRRKIAWRVDLLADIEVAHAFVDRGTAGGIDRHSVCGVPYPERWRGERREKCRACELALARLW